MPSETYADLGGHPTDEPPTIHDPACDGTGWTRDRDEDAVPVRCPACRPWLPPAGHRTGRRRRHAMLTNRA